MIGEENMAAVNAIMESAGLIPQSEPQTPAQEQAPEQAPVSQPSAQPQVQPEANTTVPPTQGAVTPAPTQLQAPALPQQDYQALLEGMQSVQAKLAQMEQGNQPQAPLNEEEQALAILAEKLGVSALKDENATLKQQLQTQSEQQKQQEQFRQQMEAKAKFERDISTFSNGKPDNVVEMLGTKLNQIAAQYGEQYAAQFDNPVGWQILWDGMQQQAQPQNTPDPIIGTGNATSAVQTEDAFTKLGKGQEVSNLDLGNAILNMSGGN